MSKRVTHCCQVFTPTARADLNPSIWIRQMPRQICRGCGGTEVYYDYGAEICIKCGNVMEESGIVAEVTFGEASNGAAMAYGKNVPAGGGE